MRILLKLVTLLGFLCNDAQTFQPTIRSIAKRSFLSTLESSRPDLHEFDHIFDEATLLGGECASSGVKIRLPPRPGERAVVLASSTAVIAPSSESESLRQTTADTEEELDFDPYGDFTSQEQETLRRYEVQGQQASLSQNFENRLKQMDLQDIVSTLILPAIVGGFAVKWAIQRVSMRVAGKTNDILDRFATEMIYHDGDFEEMKLCFQDYTKKLTFLGPKKTSAMLKRYLELYSKKKTVSPQSIR
jgi:hypothetical protein